MNNKSALTVLIVIILLFAVFAATGRLDNETVEDKEAERIRTGCKATIMYVIDDFNRVRRVYDCGELP